MEDILHKLGLESLCKRFDEENITPSIVCKLSKYDLQCLGLVSSSDMMKLRVVCIKFGNPAPMQMKDSRKKYEISQTVLENLLERGFSIKDISKLLAVSERTIYRRMTHYGLTSCSFTDIDDDDLDKVLEETTLQFPRCGEKMLRQLLVTKGIKVTRSRIRDALGRVDSDGTEERKKRRLHRRVYSVPAPNHLWHIDTNHKLIRWNFEISGGIDGFSRYVVFLNCVDNNRAETIFSYFQFGVQNNGIPMRVRSDQGLENLKVAEYMLTAR
ncbi:Hypothetical predicted protein [Mytilus galloprovincialis]|uniref:Integrase catalytic domain-containing protein n=1 Tax=Mytilus galloprovincialis TaxID=29158 RepID=A0A8B6GVS1_MYTGA|nr:Hypothetical predicted protein [Mytilus galloprovincialis]